MEVLALILFLLWLLTRSATSRGKIGEERTKFNLWLSLDSKTYQTFHDLIVPSENGTAQIDHLLVSPYGIFIVETKNLKGWIFGSENQARWTQSIYGKNFTFQNPLRQTFRQKRLLSEYLNLDEAKVHVVVNFAGNCSFKTPMPSNVVKKGLGAYIKRYREAVFSSDEINNIIEQLMALSSNRSLTTKKHIKSLKQRHNSRSICSKCGSALVERTARRGARSGLKFLGCRNYPRCKFTKTIY